MKRFFLRSVLSLVIAGIAFSSFVNCYGKFPLIRLVHNVNGQVGGKLGLSGLAERLVNTIVMWIIMIIPVYGLAGLVDILLMNAIEFWTGSPFNIGENTIEKDGKKITQKMIDQNTMLISLSEKDTTRDYYLFRDKPGEFYEKVDGKYVKIEIQQTGIDENSITISYKDSRGEKVTKVSRNMHNQLASKVVRMVELAEAKKERSNYASVPSTAPVY